MIKLLKAGLFQSTDTFKKAKETKNKTAFPLSNIHAHQIKHLESVIRHGGIGFVIVSFTTISKIYLLKAEDLINFMNTSSRKSIPLNYFEEKAYLLKFKINPRIDYLKAIDIIYRGEF